MPTNNTAEHDENNWTAILLAGQRPAGDPLANIFGVKHKALIKIADKTMLRRVADTLLGSPKISRVVIIAQSPNELIVDDTTALAENDRVAFIQGNDGIATSIASVAGTAAAPWPMLVTTADNALLTPEIVNYFLSENTDNDLSVGVVERALMMKHYPETKRTWLKFKGGAYSGANLFAFKNSTANKALTLWSSIEQDRKKSWKIMSRFGPWLLLRAVTRTITFENAMRKAGKQLSIRAQPVVLPFAEAAIDVDKPDDLELATEILLKRQSDHR